MRRAVARTEWGPRGGWGVGEEGWMQASQQVAHMLQACEALLWPCSALLCSTHTALPRCSPAPPRAAVPPSHLDRAEQLPLLVLQLRLELVGLLGLRVALG